MITTKEYVSSKLPRRSPLSNKGTYGRVLLACGSGNMRGAAALATLGALRCGAGLVTLASEKCVIDALSASIFEAVWLDTDIYDMIDASDSANAVGIGCGSGNTRTTYKNIKWLMEREGAPLVIDADGLNVLAGHTDLFRKAKREIIITPHPLEFSRLCGTPVTEIQSNREEYAKRFASEYGITVLLKGRGTVITNGEEVFVNPTGSSALAKGGSGDVLCGMICAFLAQGASPLDAAVIGAYVHGLAGERLGEKISEYGVLASEIPLEAAKILKEF
ncbi:MAG: NAD(P)H-hydrate dehydratase [Ruminococcaceae bacterium]|nr:NAD(P)H-hydrate dehydratase [Oscillospiraceae bacterium]